MKYSAFFSHSLTHREKQFGAVWLTFKALLFSRAVQLLNTLLPTPMPQVYVNFLIFCTNFVVVVALFRKYLLGQCKLIPDTWASSFVIAMFGFAVYCLSRFFLQQLFLAVDPDFNNMNDMTVRKLVQENYVLMLLGTVVLVPIAEECLFRGLVFRGLYDYSPPLAWIASAVLFSLVHLIGYMGQYPLPTMLMCFVQYLPAGLCLAGAYRLSGSLLSPILIHALVNLMGMLALR